MTLSVVPFFSSLKQLLTQPWFWMVFLLAGVIGTIRGLVWLDWWSLLPVGLFVMGSLLGYWLIMAHEQWIPAIIRNMPTLDDSDTGAVAVLRSPLMFILLPILGTFLLFLPNSMLGLGVFWGILGWYASEAWPLVQGKPEWMSRYFPHLTSLQTEPIYLGVLWGFLSFCGLFALILAIL